MMKTIRQGRIYDNTSPASLTSASIRNTVPPVSRLPLELLPSIFLYCVLDSYHGNVNGDIGVPKWVAVSYVCRCWRSVALGCPTLWSYMFVACPSWTEQLLARSRGLPLRVRVYMTPFNDNATAFDFLEQIVHHAQRFREFRLYIHTYFVECISPLLSPRSVPLLSTLAISCTLFPYTASYQREPRGVDDEVAFDDDEDSEAVDPNGSSPLFDEDLPSLRELDIKGYPFSWCSPTLGGLTVLRLTGLHYKVRPTIAELTDLLGNMPDLVRLHLEDAIRGGFHDYDSDSLECESVHLPRLEKFSLSAPFSRMVALLPYMVIPATTRLRFRIRLETVPNLDDFPAFNAFLSQRFQDAPSFAPIRTLHLNSSGPHLSAFFSASQDECDHPKCCSSLFNDCRCDISLKIDVEWQSEADNWRDLVYGICCNVPLASLETLFLDCRRLPAALWFDVIWHLPKLRYIAFAGGVLSDVITMLSLPPRPLVQGNMTHSGAVDPHTSQIFAPSLEDLYLGGVEIPRPRRCGGNPSVHKTYLTILYDALAQRKAAGRPIRRLGINGTFSLTPNEVQRMEEVCPGMKTVNDGASFVEELNASSCKDCRPGLVVEDENP